MPIKINMEKITVICPTYNQESFIRKTIESIVEQKTNFKFKLLIGDDCSLDSSIEIIKHYQKKYPKIIKAIFRKKNIGSMENLKDLFCQCKSKYISICEGDDFFTDPNKLQIQADYLDKHPECSLCFHPVNVFVENQKDSGYIYPDPKLKFSKNTKELVKWNFIQTNSVMYVNQYDYKNIPTNIIPGDWFLHLYHAKKGKIGFINKVMSSYRRHPKSLWWNYDKNISEILKKYSNQHLGMYFAANKLFDKNTEYENIIFKNIEYVFRKIIETDLKEKTTLTEKAIKNYPEEVSIFLKKSFYRKENTGSFNVDKKLEELKKIKDSKLYKLWPIYEKIKKIFI